MTLRSRGGNRVASRIVGKLALGEGSMESSVRQALMAFLTAAHGASCKQLKFVNRMPWLAAVAAVGATTISSCTIFPWHRNRPLQQCPQASGQRAGSISPAPPSRFVALAFSGGGNRAANFGAAMLYQLNQLGMLKEVNYLSSASGGSLPAAYFALASADLQRAGREAFEKKMSEACLQARFGRDFQERWLLEWFFTFPWDLISAHTRTDLMAGTLNAELFTDSQGKTASFGDLPQSPKLFINATDLAEGRSFSFTLPTFSDQMCSDLSSLPIGTAVAASAAFPAAFRPVAFEDFSNQAASGEIRYIHLFDAGVSDNLALEALNNEFGRLQEQSHGQNIPCMIISVDAFQPLSEVAHYESQPKVKKWYDLGIDITTVERSASVQLQHHREHELRDLGFDESQISGQFNDGRLGEQSATDAFPESSPTGMFSRLRGCKVWHADLASWSKRDYLKLYTKQLPAKYKSPVAATVPVQAYDDFVDRMTSYPTDFRIVDDEHMRDFYAAAWLKVNQRYTREKLCNEYKTITGEACKPTVATEASEQPQSFVLRWVSSELENSVRLNPREAGPCD